MEHQTSRGKQGQAVSKSSSSQQPPSINCAKGELEITPVALMFIERMLLPPDNLQKQTHYCQKVGQCHLKPAWNASPQKLLNL